MNNQKLETQIKKKKMTYFTEKIVVPLALAILTKRTKNTRNKINK